jgi:NADH:ubiquinone reductase (H+-translocating)
MINIVIIGGGYAGIAAIRELVKFDGIQITLLDKHSYHYLQPDVYDFMANKIDTAAITIDLITMLAAYNEKITLFSERVDHIDFEDKCVKTEHDTRFFFDYLLIAVGSKTSYPPQLPGAEHCEDIKRLHKALEFKQKYESALFWQIYNEAKQCDIMQIVIIGGGLSGVEIAAEMAHYSQVFFKTGLFACGHMKIYLIEGASTILPGMSQFVIQKSTTRLTELNVDIITGQFVRSLENQEVILANGTTIAYSFCIFTGGIEAANLTKRINVEKNKRHQLMCDSYCRIKGSETVFAAGDCMEVPNENGTCMPATVRTSLQTGMCAARNMICTINQQPLKPCKTTIPGVMVALGGKCAVGEIYVKQWTFQFSGYLAYCIKHCAFWLYKAPLIALSKKGYARFWKKLS